MGMPAETRRWTAAQVRDLQAQSPPGIRYELIAGTLIVTNSPRVAHQRAVGQLYIALANYLEAEPVGEVLTSPADLELRPENITQPDVFVVPTEPVLVKEWADVRALLLAVEVLSPSTAKHDRTTKRAYYQSVEVPEYWVVDVNARLVERWRPGNVVPEIARDALVWAPEGARTPLTIDLTRLFARALGDGTASLG